MHTLTVLSYMGATATLGQTAMRSAPLDHHQRARRGFETATHWLQDKPLSHHHPDEEQEREDGEEENLLDLADLTQTVLKSWSNWKTCSKDQKVQMRAVLCPVMTVFGTRVQLRDELLRVHPSVVFTCLSSQGGGLQRYP
ncbi:hypothetical protein XENOCAPTIV_019506 [Xenoophorus captivus]|uniref:Uncharacterized protein n=1 Tax=Xenoophorus captivus TaxID=1517983 RepID=A0ABV0S8K3_9TELE